MPQRTSRLRSRGHRRRSRPRSLRPRMRQWQLLRADDRRAPAQLSTTSALRLVQDDMIEASGIGTRKRPWHRLSDLPAVTQIVIGKHARDHGFANRHGANTDAGVVTALGDDVGIRSISIYGPPGRQDGGSGLNRKPTDNRLSRGNTAENTTRL